MSYHLMCKTISWNKESSITVPKEMMTWTQKKQREKCQVRQLEEIEGDSVNDDGHLSSPKTGLGKPMKRRPWRQLSNKKR